MLQEMINMIDIIAHEEMMAEDIRHEEIMVDDNLQ